MRASLGDNDWCTDGCRITQVKRKSKRRTFNSSELIESTKFSKNIIDPQRLL